MQCLPSSENKKKSKESVFMQGFVFVPWWGLLANRWNKNCIANPLFSETLRHLELIGTRN